MQILRLASLTQHLFSLKYPDQKGSADESCGVSTDQSFPRLEPVMHG